MLLILFFFTIWNLNQSYSNFNCFCDTFNSCCIAFVADYAMGFNPEQYYSVNRMPQRRSLLRAASRDFEVYFTDIESVLDRIKEIFNHLINKLISEIQQDLPGHSHSIRLVLNAPTLNYPIHIPFSSVADFNAEMILDEIDRVVSSNESFDISNNIKVNVLSVSLPTMGGNRLGGIQSRTVPDIKLFTKQKKSIIVIKSDQNDCLLRAIAIGIKVKERSARPPNKKKRQKTCTWIGLPCKRVKCSI